MVSLGVLAALSLTACGSSSSSSSSAKSASSSSTSTSSSPSSSSTGANIVAARAAIAPYEGRASAFPVTTPLGKPIPPGTKIAYLQCATSVCAVVGQLLPPAIKTLGATLIVVKAGDTATSSQAAASTVLALKPAAVILTGVQPSEFGGRLQKLSAAGIKVVSISIAQPNVKQFGITFNYVGLAQEQEAGHLMANWVIANKGPKANVVFYGVPELDFSSYMQQSFEQELAKNCPSCKVRAVPIDITTIGSTAPQTVVTDLQSHPDTNTAVFASAEIQTGLPAALKSAGLKVTTLGFAPTPANLEDIKTGADTAGFAVDLPVATWAGVDAAARLILHEPPTPGEVKGDDPEQYLTQKDITFDPAHGWTGYPNFAPMFAKLWHPAP